MGKRSPRVETGKNIRPDTRRAPDGVLLVIVFILLSFLGGIGWGIIPDRASDLRKCDAFVWADDEDFPPFVYRDQDGEIKGIFKDLMVELFHRADVPLQYNVYAWKRAQLLVRQGAADGMVTVLTQDRAKWCVATDPLLQVRERIFARRDNPRFHQIESIDSIDGLKGFRVISVVGSAWERELFEGKNLHIVKAPTNVSAFLMLANGRGDLYLASRFTGGWTIDHLKKKYPQFRANLDKIVACPKGLATVRFLLLINKDSRWVSLVPKLNEALHAMHTDKTAERIVDRAWK